MAFKACAAALCSLINVLIKLLPDTIALALARLSRPSFSLLGRGCGISLPLLGCCGVAAAGMCSAWSRGDVWKDDVAVFSLLEQEALFRQWS